jgi:hypothetical protein
MDSEVGAKWVCSVALPFSMVGNGGGGEDGVGAGVGRKRTKWGFFPLFVLSIAGNESFEGTLWQIQLF